MTPTISRIALPCAALYLAMLSMPPMAAVAQDAAPITPPVVQNDTDVPYPTDAQGDASVLLELVVEADGSVSNAHALEGAEPFAEQARQAVLAWHFEPAHRGDSAVAARIRARVEFHQEQPEPSPPPPPTAAAPRALPAPTPTTELPLEVTVRGYRGDVGKTTISASDVRAMPGAFGDPFRVIEALPGVTPIVSGLPYFYVRGAPPNDNGYYVDGVRVPQLFHIGIGQGVIHAGLIDHVDFYPGVAPASYMGSAGSTIAGQTREPASKFHGEANLRLLDVGALVEAPFDYGRGSALIAGHYGYPGLILGMITSKTTLGYWDYQARATARIADHDTLGLFAFGGHDDLGTVRAGRTVELFGSDFHRIDLRYDHALVDGHIRVGLTGGYDTQGGSLSTDEAPAKIGDLSAVVRLEIDSKLTPTFKLRGGADAHIDQYAFEQGTAAPDPGGAIQPAIPSSADPPPTNLSGGAYIEAIWNVTPGVEITPGVRVDELESSRANSSATTARTHTSLPAFDPRLSARVTLARDVAWLSTFGLSHQYPSLRVGAIPAPILTIPGFPVGDKQLQTVWRGSQGIEVTLPADIVLTATGFAASWSGLSDLTDNCIMIMPAALPGMPDGPPPTAPYHCPSDRPVTGLAYGGELSLRRPLSKRLSGWLSYTLSRSTRKTRFVTADGGDAVAKVASEFDRTHVLSAILAYDFGAGWRGGARFVFYTGAPYSKLDGNVPVPPYNSMREPSFYRFDVRLEKRWQLGSDASIAFVLEGQNITLRKEVSALTMDCEGMATAQAITTQCKHGSLGPITLPSVGVEAFF